MPRRYGPAGGWHIGPPPYPTKITRVVVVQFGCLRLSFDSGRAAQYRQIERGPHVPELLVDFITSLDGYGAAEGWPGWWGLEGPEYLGWLQEQPEADFTILMGANTYRLMSGFVADGEPGTDVLSGMSKIVFSSSLTEPLSWANSRLITGDAVDAVREMKQNGDESMRTLGSLALCRSLLTGGPRGSLPRGRLSGHHREHR